MLESTIKELAESVKVNGEKHKRCEGPESKQIKIDDMSGPDKAKTYTSYEQHIRDSFTAAYKFMMAHAQPRTDEQWEAILNGASALRTTPLGCGLWEAIIAEFGREYLQDAAEI